MVETGLSIDSKKSSMHGWHVFLQLYGWDSASAQIAMVKLRLAHPI
jgi:hypothetical protein